MGAEVDALTLDQEVKEWQNVSDKIIPDLYTFYLFEKRYINTFIQIESFATFIDTFHLLSVFDQDLRWLKKTLLACNWFLLTKPASNALVRLNKSLHHQNIGFSINCDKTIIDNLRDQIERTKTILRESPSLALNPHITKEALRYELKKAAKENGWGVATTEANHVPKNLMIDFEKPIARQHQFREMVEIHIIWLRAINKIQGLPRMEEYNRCSNSFDYQYDWVQRVKFPLQK